MTDTPEVIEDELTSDVMWAEIIQMATGSVTLTVNEFQDTNQTIENAIAELLNADIIDTDQSDSFLTSGMIVQMTVNGVTDEETIDVYAPTLEEAIGVMYFTLKSL